jgi:hypothetical protein
MCGKEISPNAESCPNCGEPVIKKTEDIIEEDKKIDSSLNEEKKGFSKNTGKNKKIIIVAILVLLLALSAFFVSTNVLYGDDLRAYETLTAVIDDFVDPGSVRIISGDFLSDTGQFYAKISAKNGFGNRVTENYMIAEEDDGSYTMHADWEYFEEVYGFKSLNYKKINKKIEKEYSY